MVCAVSALVFIHPLETSGQRYIMLYRPEGHEARRNPTFAERGQKSISSSWSSRVERSDTSEDQEEDIDFCPSSANSVSSRGFAE